MRPEIEASRRGLEKWMTRVHRVEVLSRETGGRLDTAAQALEVAIERIGGRIRVSGSSRLVTFHKLLTELERLDRREVLLEMVEHFRTGSLDHPYQDHLHSLLEGREVSTIVDQLLDDLSDSELGDLVSGALDAADDGHPSTPRNKQFEFFVAACLRRAGTRVRLHEPDVVAELRTGALGIAAKRSRSRTELRKRIDGAAKQVERSGMPGVVVVDVSMLMNPPNTWMVHERDADKDVPGKVLALIHKERPGEIKEAAFRRSSLVRAVVVRAALPLASFGQKFGTYENWHVVAPPGGVTPDVRELMDGVLAGAP